MGKPMRLVYAAIALTAIWIVVIVVLLEFRGSLRPYPRWLDFVTAGLMLIGALVLAFRMVIRKRVSVGAILLISTLVLILVTVAVGAKGMVLSRLRDVLAVATVVALLFEYLAARRRREKRL